MLASRRVLAVWVVIIIGVVWLGPPLLQPYAPACLSSGRSTTRSSFNTLFPNHSNYLVDAPPTVAAPGAGDVAILSCFSGQLSENGKQSISSKQEYAKYWGYDIHISVNEPMTGDKQGSWNKVFALRRLMRLNPQTAWFWVTDADLLIMNPALTIEEHILEPLNLMPGKTNDTSTYLIIGIDCNCINAGSFLIRNIPEAHLFLDLMLDPFLHGLPYGEQDAMSHLLSHHPILLSKTALVPLRMLNAYPPSSCPVSEAATGPAHGEWNPILNKYMKIIPGYEYGPLETLGWNERIPTQNWSPVKKKIRVVDQFGQPVETRDQSPQEESEEYRKRMETEGRPYDPVILRDEGKPPASPPGTQWSVLRPMTKEEKDKVEWQWWHDPRLRNGRYHYMPNDFTIHLAGCWLVEGQCEATWDHFFSVRTKATSLPKTRTRPLLPKDKVLENIWAARIEPEVAPENGEQLVTVLKQSTLDDPVIEDDQGKELLDLERL